MDKPKDFAETLVDDLITVVRAFEGGRSSWKTVELHAEGIKQALRVPSPNSEDFPDMRDQFAMAALPAIIPGADPKMWAACAFEVADAMMAARNPNTTGASAPEGAQS